MKKRFTLAIIATVLFSQMRSDAYKPETIKPIKENIVEKTVQEEVPFVEEIDEAFKEYNKIELNCITKDLDALVEVYNKNNLEELKKFPDELIYETFPEKFFKNLFDSQKKEEIKDRAFFFLFNYLIERINSLTDKVGDNSGINDKEKKELFKEAFQVLTGFYDKNKELVNKIYSPASGAPFQKYSKLYSLLSKFIDKMPEEKKQTSSLKSLEMLSEHLTDVEKTTKESTLIYLDIFKTINQNISDDSSINKEFYEKITDMILNFYSNKNKIVKFSEKDIINTLFKSAMNSSQEKRKEAYFVLKEMLLSQVYHGGYPQDISPTTTPFIFYDFFNCYSDIFNKVLSLLDGANLDKARELSSLENTIARHVRGWIDYAPQMQIIPWRVEIIKNSYKFMHFISNEETRNNFNKTLNREFSNMILYDIARKQVYLNKISFYELFDSVKNSGNETTLNSLISPLKKKIVFLEDPVGFKEYLFFMGMINTSDSAESFFSLLNSNQIIEGKLVPFAKLFSKEDFSEVCSCFDYDLLVKQIGRDENSLMDKSIEEELEKKIKTALSENDFASLQKFAENSLECNNTFFLKYYDNCWNQIGENVLDKTSLVLQQIYLPNQPFVYLKNTVHLPSNKAVEQINALYSAGNDVTEKNNLTESYENMFKTLGEEGYFVLVKNIIDTLKEINSEESLQSIRRISETNDEDDELREYAKHALQ